MLRKVQEVSETELTANCHILAVLNVGEIDSRPDLERLVNLD